MSTAYRLKEHERGRIEQLLDDTIKHNLNPYKATMKAEGNRWWAELLTEKQKLLLATAKHTGYKGIIETAHWHDVYIARDNWESQKRNFIQLSYTSTNSLPDFSRTGDGLTIIYDYHPMHTELLQYAESLRDCLSLVRELGHLTGIIRDNISSVGQMRVLIPDLFSILPAGVVGRAREYKRKPRMPAKLKPYLDSRTESSATLEKLNQYLGTGMLLKASDAAKDREDKDFHLPIGSVNRKKLDEASREKVNP
jgi:hypothetical protein